MESCRECYTWSPKSARVYASSNKSAGVYGQFSPIFTLIFPVHGHTFVVNPQAPHQRRTNAAPTQHTMIKPARELISGRLISAVTGCTHAQQVIVFYDFLPWQRGHRPNTSAVWPVRT